MEVSTVREASCNWSDARPHLHLVSTHAFIPVDTLQKSSFVSRSDSLSSLHLSLEDHIPTLSTAISPPNLQPMCHAFSCTVSTSEAAMQESLVQSLARSLSSCCSRHEDQLATSSTLLHDKTGNLTFDTQTRAESLSIRSVLVRATACVFYSRLFSLHVEQLRTVIGEFLAHPAPHLSFTPQPASQGQAHGLPCSHSSNQHF